MSNEPTPAIVTASNLTVRYNEQVVLDRASLAICEGERLGLVGRNGSGKSTFLRLLTGEQTPDHGEILRRPDLIIGYLPQEFALDPARTVYETILSGARHVLDLIHEFESLPATSKRHAVLEDRIMALDGWHLDYRIKTAMSHLNVPAGDRLVGSLSGGEKRRVAMCRAIISRPDFLLLDEPTNHLDADSIDWVSEFLRDFPGTFLLVTHDRYFLDRAVDKIIELDQGVFFPYDGNYTDYLLNKAQRQATEEMEERKRQSFLRRELDWVRRGPQARTTKAKSRLDQYFAVAAQAAPEPVLDVDMVIPPAPKLANRVVDLINVGVEMGGKSLFRDFNFKFVAGMKVGVTGRNGLGKTTLLKVIQGQLTPNEGSVKAGMLTQFNYVDQYRLQLDGEKTVMEEVGDGTEFVVYGDGRLSLRAYLKRFLFSDDRINTRVKHLSGGERSRLLLARILKNGGNFLILDEPTNDLDLSTLRVLEEALLAFSGCVLVVSHDRYFLNRVCNGMLVFEGEGKITYCPGNYDYYLENAAQRAASLLDAKPEPPTSSKTGPPNPSSQADQRPRKLSWKESRELEGMEKRISDAESEIARIEALFMLPDFHQQHGPQAGSLMDNLTAAKEELAQLYTRWEELETLAATTKK